MRTKLLTAENIPEAAEILRRGGLVAVPTETVYGLACNGLDPEAVERVFEVKGRPENKPLSLMISDSVPLDEYSGEVPEAARRLRESFFPGPLTIVLPVREGMIPMQVRAGGSTIGLRCPDHPLTLELLRLASIPLAVPSANPSGLPSAKSAAEALNYFDGAIDAVLDGGVCGLGTESTVLDMSVVPFRVLRQGALPAAAIEETLLDNMTIIGITGPSGGGKSTALAAVDALGGLALECDEIYHQLTQSNAEMLSELNARFPGVVTAGVLDRRELGNIVFADPGALSDLGDITHKYVTLEVERRLRDWAWRGGTLAGIDAVALIESGAVKLCTRVYGVTAPAEIRIERIMARDGISRERAIQRVTAQQSDEFYARNCDEVLQNSGGSEEFKLSCEELFRNLQLEKSTNQ